MRASPRTARQMFARPGMVLRLIGIIAVLAAAAALAGCGGGSEGSGVARADDAAAGSASATDGTSTTPASSDPEQAQLDFARCMREQGLDFPDPQPDENGNLRFQGPAGGAGGDQEAFRAAGEECRQYLQGAIGGLPDPDSSEFQDAQLEFARCMRGEGIDVPDPTPGQVPGAGGARQLDRNDPALAAAFDKCAPAIQGAFGQGDTE